MSAEIFGVLARTVHRTAQEASAILRAEGLNPAQFQLLLAVRANPDEFQQVVGQRLGVTAAAVSMLVTKLQNAGLLGRVPEGAANRLRLTHAGRELVDRLAPQQDAFMAQRFAALDDAELAELHRLASRAFEGLPAPS
ncbi:MarR family winged helix-turn-helix transcriptional regulator [Actinoplanes sp. CA-030573]|uniref:MarR family winged helix-turn-helix transcriptional regulator n=1 Tax=Actinoplanes sp. CA-030573 TaxID=3239898 RepID=UPI003D8C7A57